MVAGVPNSLYGNEGEMFVSLIKGKYTERALRGNIFTLQLPATTTGVAAGNISGAAAAAVTQFALWNPPGSGKYLALLRMWIAPISGTPAGGPLFHNISSTAPTIGSVGTITSVNPFSPVSSKASCMASAAGSALTGGGALTSVRPSSLFFSASAFANAAGGLSVEEIDGSILLPPSYLWVPCWAAAGTTLLNAYGVMWEEISQ